MCSATGLCSFVETKVCKSDPSSFIENIPAFSIQKIRLKQQKYIKRARADDVNRLEARMNNNVEEGASVFQQRNQVGTVCGAANHLAFGRPVKMLIDPIHSNTCE
jgi:hypothetical protein